MAPRGKDITNSIYENSPKQQKKKLRFSKRKNGTFVQKPLQNSAFSREEKVIVSCGGGYVQRQANGDEQPVDENGMAYPSGVSSAETFNVASNPGNHVPQTAQQIPPVHLQPAPQYPHYIYPYQPELVYPYPSYTYFLDQNQHVDSTNPGYPAHYQNNYANQGYYPQVSPFQVAQPVYYGSQVITNGVNQNPGALMPGNNNGDVMNHGNANGGDMSAEIGDSSIVHLSKNVVNNYIVTRNVSPQETRTQNARVHGHYHTPMVPNNYHTPMVPNYIPAQMVSMNNQIPIIHGTNPATTVTPNGYYHSPMANINSQTPIVYNNHMPMVHINHTPMVQNNHLNTIVSCNNVTSRVQKLALGINNISYLEGPTE